MKIPSPLGVVFLLFSSLTSLFGQVDSGPSAQIEMFLPQGLVKQTRQVKVRFSDQMVPFGDPGRVADPFEIDCSESGSGRWIDSNSWVYDFERDLPSGIRCRFKLREGVSTVESKEIEGKRVFEFSTGGPSILTSVPYQGNMSVNEDQVFILELDGAVESDSVLTSVYFLVDGILSEVGVRIIDGDEREEVLSQQYRYRDRPPDHVVLIQALQVFPPGTRVSLVWEESVRSPSGIMTGQEQVFEFKTRQAFRATFQCQRENARSDCIPLTPMRLVFSGPVHWESVRKARLVGEDGDLHEPMSSENEWVSAIRFRGPFPPNSEYLLEIPAGIRDDAGRSLENESLFPLTVRTDDYPTLAKFPSTFGILEAEVTPVLPVTVRRLEKELDLDVLEIGGPSVISGKLKRIQPSRSIHILDWIRKLRKQRWKEKGISVFESTLGSPQEFRIPRPNDAESFEVVGIPLNDKGFYVVELKSELLGRAYISPPGPMYVATAALVTNLGVHLKWGLDTSLIWVTELDSAEPVEGAEVQVYDCAGNQIGEGRSDSSGRVSLEGLPDPNEVPRCSYAELESGLFVTAEKGDDFSFVHSDWDDGIEAWRFQVPRKWDSSLIKAHTIFDRSLFRAGETVHMKHFIRWQGSAGLESLEQAKLPDTVVICHASVQQDFELPISWSHGSSVIDWTIPVDAKLGVYSVTLRSREGELFRSGSFRVEEFRVPLMRGKIFPPSETLVGARSLNVGASVEYLSGGPASRLPVRLRYQVVPKGGQSFAGFEGFLFASGGVKEGIARRGEPRAETPNNLKSLESELDEEGWADFDLEINEWSGANATVRSELEFRDPNGEIQTVAQQIPLYISSLLVGIKPENWARSEKGLSFKVAVVDLEGRAVSATEVEVDLYEQKNYSHRKRLVGGFYGYENYTEISRFGRICEGLTDDAGILDCQVESSLSGSVIAVASVADQSGNVSLANHGFWIAGEEDWWFRAENHDRIDLIPEQKQYQPGETARLQVRMPFRTATALITVEREGIVDSFVQKISGQDPVLEVPVKNNYAPNVFLSVLLVRGRVGEVQPTAIIDLGRPAFKMGISSLDVDWKSHQLRVEVKPDAETYAVRETAEVQVSVQPLNGPSLDPEAEIALAVVDEGLLELLPNLSWNLLEAMMSQRRHGVNTATAQMQVVGKRHFGLKALPDGGGGGKQSTRELFDTLLYWKGRIKLDQDGKTTVSVPLNDSITSFRVVAIASDGVSRFGTSFAVFRTTQDLVISSSIPPLVRGGDQVRAEFSVRNASNRSLTLNVKAEVTPLSEEPEMIRLDLDPGVAEVVEWDIQVPSDLDQLEYTVEAVASSGETDRITAIQKVIRLHPVRTLQATLARLEGPAEVDVEKPEMMIPGTGGIAVSLDRSIVNGLEGVTEYMVSYPYNCLEQELSRVVALDDREAWESWMEVLPAFLDRDGLVKYYAPQRYGSEILTSYILSVGHEAGWPIPTDSAERMLDGLIRFVNGEIVRLGIIPAADLTLRKVASLEALSRYDRVNTGLFQTFVVNPNLWPTSTLIEWVNVLGRVTAAIPRGVILKRQAEQILLSRVSSQGAVAGFSTESQDRLWWLMVSGDVNMSRLILYLLEYRPSDPDLPRLLNGFLNRRRAGHWDLTTANAWGSLAVRKFADRFESDQIEGSTAIQVSDEQDSFNWSESEKFDKVFDWPQGRVKLRAEHTGSGAPWLSIRSQAAVPTTEPVTSGFQIRKSISALEQKEAGKWQVGDILRVHLEIEAQSEIGWVVVWDPIPAGGLILGSGLGTDSALSVQDEESDDLIWPVSEERSFDSYRAYYRYVPSGTFSVEYTVRLNAKGVFDLPSSRVEAMYYPEMFAEFPNSRIIVE